MNQHDYKTFAEAWATAHEVMPAGKVLSHGAMKLCIEALSQYPIESLLLAIKKHVQSARFAPAPADIINLLEAHNKRPTADEAWAMMPYHDYDGCTKNGNNPFIIESTVVATSEMLGAYALAIPLLEAGDKIAARMAFRGTYERLCNESNIMGRGIKWVACIGYDKAKIEPVLMKAVAAGRITQDRANKYLPAPAESGFIAGLLSGKVTEMPANNENLKKHWHGLGEALKAGLAKREQAEKQRIIDAQNKRLEFEQKRQAQIDAVNEKLGAMN